MRKTKKTREKHAKNCEKQSKRCVVSCCDSQIVRKGQKRHCVSVDTRVELVIVKEGQFGLKMENGKWKMKDDVIVD